MFLFYPPKNIFISKKMKDELTHINTWREILDLHLEILNEGLVLSYKNLKEQPTVKIAPRPQHWTTAKLGRPAQ